MSNETVIKKDDKVLNHIRNIKLIQALYQGKKFFVQCYPTDNGAECFPNTNFAVKEIELPSFELTQEKERYKWVSEKEISEHATNEVNRTLGELVEWMEDAKEYKHEFLQNGIEMCINKAKSLLKQEGIEKTYGEKLIDAIEKLEQMGLWEEWKEENPSRVNALKKLINS